MIKNGLKQEYKYIDQARYEFSDPLVAGASTFNINDKIVGKSSHLVCKIIQQTKDYERLHEKIICCKHIMHPIGVMKIPNSSKVGIVRNKIFTSLDQYINIKRLGQLYLNPQAMKKIVIQLIESISSLSGAKRGHGNLKLENILLTERLDLYMVDLNIEIQLWDQIQYQQDTAICGQILFCLATLKTSNIIKTIKDFSLQSQIIKEAFLSVQQIYGKEFIFLVKALMGVKVNFKTFEQICSNEYQTYVNCTYHHVQTQILSHIEREQNFLLTLVKSFKSEINKNGYNADEYFSIISHNRGNLIGTRIESLLNSQIPLDQKFSEEDQNLLQKYLVNPHDFNIDVASFQVRLLDKKINIALEDDLDQELERLDEFHQENILKSQLRLTPTQKDSVGERSSIFSDINNEFEMNNSDMSVVLQRMGGHNSKDPELQKQILSQLQELKLKKAKKFKNVITNRLQDYNYRSEKVCDMIKEDLKKAKVSIQELNRMFQQYDMHRDNFVADFVFLFIVKKHHSSLKKEDLQPVIHKFRSQHTLKKSKQIFVNYILFIERVGDKDSQDQILAVDCEVLLKKLHSTVIHHCINFQGSFQQVDHEKTGRISYDGWMFVMGQLFAGILSNHDISELFEYYDEDKDQIINYQLILKNLFDRPDLFKVIREKLIKKLQDENKSIEDYFSSIDQDNDAFLDIMEFETSIQKIFPTIDNDDLIEVFDRFDLNRSGQISIYEFQSSIINYDAQTNSYLLMQNNIIVLQDELQEIKNNLMNSLSFEQQEEALDLDKALEEKIEKFQLFQNSNFIEITLQNKTYQITLEVFEKMVQDPQIKRKSSQHQLNIYNINQLFLESHNEQQSDETNQFPEVQIKGIKKQVSIYNITFNEEKYKYTKNLFLYNQSCEVENQEKQIKVKSLLDQIKTGCQEKDLNLFEVLVQQESDSNDYQIDTLLEFQSAIDCIDLKIQQVDLQFLFEEFKNKLTNNLSIMKISSALFEDQSQLVGLAINHMIQKENMIPSIFYEEVVEHSTTFGIDCLRKLNIEFQWEFQDIVLQEVLDQWTNDSKIILNKKSFLLLLDTLSEDTQKRQNKINYHQFLTILSQGIMTQQIYIIRWLISKAQKNVSNLRLKIKRIYYFILNQVIILNQYKRNIIQQYLGRQLKNQESQVIQENFISSSKNNCDYLWLLEKLDDFIDDQKIKETSRNDKIVQSVNEYLECFQAQNKQLEKIYQDYFTKDHQFNIDQETFIELTIKLTQNKLDSVQSQLVFQNIKTKDTESVTQSINIWDFKQFINKYQARNQEEKIENINEHRINESEKIWPLVIRQEIYQLFVECDLSKVGTINRHELSQAMQRIGINPSPIEINQLLYNIDKKQDDRVDSCDFEKIMLHKLFKDLYHGFSINHEIRKYFKILSRNKNSGINFQILDQILQKLGIDTKNDSLAYTFSKINQDQNKDINLNDFLQFINNNLYNKDHRIQNFILMLRAYKIFSFKQLKDLFDDLPNYFSLSQSRILNQKRLNLPSQAFKLQPDKTGTIFEGLYFDYQNLAKRNTQNILSLNSQNNLLLKIKLESAQNIPMPSGKRINPTHIQYREVAVMIYDKFTQTLIGNFIYVKGKLKDDLGHDWQFQSKDKALGFYMKYGDFDIKKANDLYLIFEFIVYIKSSDDIVFEISSCFGQVSLFDLHKTKGKLKMEMMGGSPQAPSSILKFEPWQQESFHFFKRKQCSILTIMVENVSKRIPLLQEISHLPNFCLVNRYMTTILATFREWCAREIITQQNNIDREFISDPLYLAFLYFIDCPDICKRMYKFWNNINFKKSSILIKQQSFTILLQQLIQCTQYMDFQFNPAKPTDRISVRQQQVKLVRKKIVKTILLYVECQINNLILKHTGLRNQSQAINDFGLQGHLKENYGPFDLRDDIFQVHEDYIVDNLS